MATTDHPYAGLTTQQIQASRQAHGSNTFEKKEENAIWLAAKELASEPLSILLLATAGIYFVMGKTEDGYFMVGAIAIVSSLSLYQNARTHSALQALNQLIQPKCKVIRGSKVQEILSDEIVVGDVLQLEEGATIPADAKLLEAHDFTIAEAVLTGESMPVTKTDADGNNQVYQGTIITTGMAIAEVTAIGSSTELGKIGKRLNEIEMPKTPLQVQIRSFVLRMVMGGAVIFCLVLGIHYYLSHQFLPSLLKALTLAMSLVPEEIPVAFTSFMALGAWRLMKAGILVKHTQTVETLGSATVICTDKTGTITENKMELAKVYIQAENAVMPIDDNLNDNGKKVLEIAMWASESIAFDPMEVAIHAAYSSHNTGDQRKAFSMVHEYPLEGKPPMMTHVFRDGTGNQIIATKGAPEAIIGLSKLSDDEKKKALEAANSLASEGYRVLGVGQATIDGDAYPDVQQKFLFDFKGLVAFYDPPKKHVDKVFKALYAAGIQVKIITGDSEATTATIANQVGFVGADKVMTGETIMQLSDKDLAKEVKDKSLFVRMFPEAKLRIINALKANGEIVAMTGDGVNDGPALKAANIGVAMGKRGTEIAKQAASLVLLHDNFEAMVIAVAMGRRIYINLKKAIQYIISIHIPIILIVVLPLGLGWIFPAIFSPVHVIFLELLMGPTCSIIYENEPMESNVMQAKPRPFTTTFFAWHELGSSLLQGLVISAGTLGIYQYAVQLGYSEEATRSMVFLTLISANVFLTLINRSTTESVIASFRRENSLIYIIIPLSVALTLGIYLIPAVRTMFDLAQVNWAMAGIAIGAGFASVIWYEGVKVWRRLVK